MARKNSNLDAAAMLAQLTQRRAMLRDRADLAAGHAELQEAAVRGDLVARQRLKLHTDSGATWYEPGQDVPIDDPTHRLLNPDLRLVTTRPRWDAAQALKQLSGYLEQGRTTIEAQVRNAAAAVDKAQAQVTRLEHELAEAQEALRQAEAARAAADQELARYVAAAPQV